MLKTNFCEMAAQYLDTNESPDEATRTDFCEAADYYLWCQLCDGALGALSAAALTITEWSDLDIEPACLQVQKFFIKYYVRFLQQIDSEPDDS